MLTVENILTKIKSAMTIDVSNTYLDGTLTVFILDAIDYMDNAGVSQSLIYSDKAIGIIYMYSVDAWQLGGSFTVSLQIQQRVKQLSMKSDIIPLETQLKETQEQLAIAKLELVTSESELLTLTNQIAPLNEQIASLIIDKSDLEAQIIYNNADIDGLNNQIIVLNDQLATLNQQEADLEAQILANNNDINNLLNQISATNDYINNLANQIITLNGNLSNLNDTLIAYNSNFADIKTSITNKGINAMSTAPAGLSALINNLSIATKLKNVNGDFMFQNNVRLDSFDSIMGFIESLISADGLFYNSSYVTSVTFPDALDTSNLINIDRLFYNCTGLKYINFGSNFKTEKIPSVSRTYNGCNPTTVLGFSFDCISNDTIALEFPTATVFKFKVGGTWGGKFLIPSVFTLSLKGLGHQAALDMINSIGVNPSGYTRAIVLSTATYNSLSISEKSALLVKNYTLSYS